MKRFLAVVHGRRQRGRGQDAVVAATEEGLILLFFGLVVFSVASRRKLQVRLDHKL